MWIISFFRTCSALLLTIVLANPISEIQAAALPTSLPAKSSEPEPGSLLEIAKRSDDDVVVVALHLNKFILSNGFIAYRDGDKYWVPLGAITQALEFPIKVDSTMGRAKGWFLSEDRKFDLDLSTGKVRSGLKQSDITRSGVERHEEDIYVRLKVLENWFPVKFKADPQKLLISVSSVELLPIEERKEREKRRQKIKKQTKQAMDPQAQVELEEPWFSMPFIDTSATASTANSKAADSLALRYSMIMGNIIGGMDTQLSVFGQSDDLPPAIRATATRYKPDGGIMGVEKVRLLKFGDVGMENDPLVANSNVGRGIQISSFRFNRVGDPKRIVLRGELPVGWEVELYQNGVLIDYIVDSSDGRFQFSDVASLPGLNNFRLVFYGPQGQKREEFRRYFSNADILGEGESNFRVSLNQKNLDLIQMNNNGSSDPDEGEVRFIASGEYGLSDDITLNGGLTTLSVNNKRHTYLRGGARASTSGTLLIGNLAVSEEGGVAADLSAQSRFDLFSVLAEHSQFQNFRSEVTQRAGSTNLLISESLGQVSSILTLPQDIRLPLTASVRQRTVENGADEFELFSRLSTRIFNYFVGGEFRQTHITARPTKRISTLRVGTTFGDFRLRSETNFDLAPEQQLNSTTMSADWSVSNGIGARVNLRHNRASGNPLTSLAAGLNSQFKQFSGNMELTVNDDGDYSGRIGLSVSWGRDPRSGGLVMAARSLAKQGSVSPFVYIDSNVNGTYDPDEDKPLADVEFKAKGISQNIPTTKDGTTFISSIPKYQRIVVKLKEASLKNPYLTPVRTDQTVFARPGVASVVDYRIVETGEVDGTIYSERNGVRSPLAGMKIQFRDESGKIVKTTISGYDGFFLAGPLPKGTYEMSPDPDQMASLEYGHVASTYVSISTEEPVNFGNDVTLLPYVASY